MRTELRYFTKNGGTKKLAEAIAKAVDVEAKTVSAPLDRYVDALFLGTSLYGGKPSSEVLDYIEKNGKNIGKIVVFGTGKTAHPAIKAKAASCGVKTAEMFFACPAPFLFFHKGHPDDTDCANAAEFAQKQLRILQMT